MSDDMPSEKELRDLQDEIEASDPHGPGALLFVLPGYAIHLEVCGAQVQLTVSRKTARELLTRLETELAPDPFKGLAEQKPN